MEKKTKIYVGGMNLMENTEFTKEEKEFKFSLLQIQLLMNAAWREGFNRSSEITDSVRASKMPAALEVNMEKRLIKEFISNQKEG